ncbi:flavin reductase (DIM6/NTAB) family NADH-FMN oxidoreductase RutF [Williamsia limnetica]|uniref:Flavin reductase (DIM6/NTAB) family NADH-FMN oxidoreductase RutF n=1 Tax=Williamsia limnetica TaxID=882452 RepID=A0A318S757_WILLI|nr:flavin reductase (DIM6/NTAB) family NADH-FMN oxidoreductase RutF [Williamsia limnetica]
MTSDKNSAAAERILFDSSNTSTRDFYKLITASVVPRPIAWVSSRSADGVDNLAPFSFFSVSSTDPVIVQFTAVGGKHSADNAAATKQFVINVATEPMTAQVNATSAGFDEDVNEFEAVGVASEPATVVDCLRVRDSPVAIECELFQIIPVGNSQVVMGKVVAITVDPAVAASDGHPDFTKLAPMARLGRTEWGLPGKVIEIARP